MDEMNLNEQELPVVPEVPDTPAPEVAAPPQRRRKPHPRQVFKEKYLPWIILGAAGLLILSFLFGSISMRLERDAAKQQLDRITELLSQEAQTLKTGAAALAASSADLTRRGAKAGPGKAIGLGAYAAWCTFATALSAQIVRLNPRRRRRP